MIVGSLTFYIFIISKIYTGSDLVKSKNAMMPKGMEYITISIRFIR